MKRIAARLVLVAAMTGALAATGGSPAFAARDICTGTFEIDGCEYCSYKNSNSASPGSKCDSGARDYYWAGCSIWVSGSCIEGTFVADAG